MAFIFLKVMAPAHSMAAALPCHVRERVPLRHRIATGHLMAFIIYLQSELMPMSSASFQS